MSTTPYISPRSLGQRIEYNTPISGLIETTNGCVKFSAHELRIKLDASISCNGRLLHILTNMVCDDKGGWRVDSTTTGKIVDTTDGTEIVRGTTPLGPKETFTRKAVDGAIREVRTAWLDYVKMYPEAGHDVLRRQAARQQHLMKARLDYVRDLLARTQRKHDLFDQVRDSINPAATWDEIEAEFRKIDYE